MIMPYIKSSEAQIEMTTTFGGYNHKPSINDGEWYDTKNLACDDFPLAATRAKRGYHDLKLNGGEVIGVCGQDKLEVVYKKDVAGAITFDVVEVFNGWRRKCTLRIPDGMISPEANDLVGFPAKIETNGSVEYIDISENTDALLVGDYKQFSVTFEYAPQTPITIDTRVSYGLPGLTNLRSASGKSIKFDMGENVEGLEDKIRDALSRGEPFYGSRDLEIVSDSGTEIIPFTYNLTTFGENHLSLNCNLTSEPQHEVTSSDYFYVKQFLSFTIDDFCLPSEAEKNTVRVEPSENLTANQLVGKIITVTTDNVPEDMIVYSNTATAEGSSYIYFTENPQINFSLDTELTLVDGRLFIADYDISIEQLSNETDLGEVMGGEHSIVKMGAYVVIFPEKIKVNTTKISYGQYSEVKSLEKSYSFNSSNWRICYFDGDEIYIRTFSDEAPSAPQHGDVWVDTSESPTVMRKYNSNLAMWAVITPCLEFYSTAEIGIEEYDALEIEFGSDLLSKLSLVENQKYYVVSSAGKYDENGKVPNNYYFRFPIAFKASMTAGTAYSATFKTSVPILDYVFECNNRLWGCRYGEDVKGDFVNEIFASRLGDPGNWHYFANTSMDAYYVSLGDEGPFTGGIAYNSQAIFFRQNKVHRISGNYPANYQLHTTIGYGCQKGSHKSIVSVNNIVYYLSAVGVMAYSGDIPVSMADAFGDKIYHSGVAGTIGNKYYLSMHEEDGSPVLFTYDDAKAMWLKEDNLDAKCFITYDNECYAIDSLNRLVATGGMTGTAESDFEWVMESGDMGYASPFRKRILKIDIRLKLSMNARARLDIQYDGDGNWINCTDIRPEGKVRSVTIPISPYRCDFFKIKLYGKGEAKVLSITKFYEEGSDER